MVAHVFRITVLPCASVRLTIRERIVQVGSVKRESLSTLCVR